MGGKIDGDIKPEEEAPYVQLVKERGLCTASGYYPVLRVDGRERMQFGWLTLALSPSPDEDAARIDQQIAQVCYAEQLGFSDVWLTEHYFTGESVYNDALMFASRWRCVRSVFASALPLFSFPSTIPSASPSNWRCSITSARGASMSGSARVRSTMNTSSSGMG